MDLWKPTADHFWKTTHLPPAVLHNAPNLYTVDLLPDEEEFLDFRTEPSGGAGAEKVRGNLSAKWLQTSTKWN